MYTFTVRLRMNECKYINIENVRQNFNATAKNRICFIG